MDQLDEARAREADEKVFEIEPLEERIAPSVPFGFTEHQGGPWVESGGQQVFMGYDPP